MPRGWVHTVHKDGVWAVDVEGAGVLGHFQLQGGTQVEAGRSEAIARRNRACNPAIWTGRSPGATAMRAISFRRLGERPEPRSDSLQRLVGWCDRSG